MVPLFLLQLRRRHGNYDQLHKNNYHSKRRYRTCQSQISGVSTMSGDMRRVETLQALIKLTKPLAAIEADVAQLPWDDQSSSAVLTKEDVRSVLERYMSTALSPREVEQWANLLEGREDVTMEQSVRDVIYQL